MKIINSSEIPTPVLRKMASWICKQLELPVRHLKEAIFTKTSWYYRGRAWSRRILIRINAQPGKRGDTYPHNHTYAGRDSENGWPIIKLNDHIDALVMLIAHELKHVVDMKKGRWRYDGSNRTHTEKMTELHAKEITEKFQAQRESLIAEWGIRPTLATAAEVAQPRSSVIDKRAAKANADLARWQRKLTLAKSKVRKYQTRVNYYRKKGISNGGTT